MNQDTFSTRLREEGFSEILTVNRPPNGQLGEHAHPFEAKALILSGEILIAMEDGVRTYRIGDIFHLHANQPHSESCGPDGVSYLVGRR